MSDIVERLAEFNQADIVDRLKQLADIEYVGSEYLAAAAEIERLRELSGDLMAERNECREERERLRKELRDCNNWIRSELGLEEAEEIARRLR